MSNRILLSAWMLWLFSLVGFCQGPVVPGTLLDAPDLAWQFSPAASFSALSGAAAFDAVDALSMAPNNLQPVVLETTVTGPALVSWYWRRTQAGNVNEDPDLNLYFLYDGNRVADHDDDQRWEKVILQMPAGVHTLQWRVPVEGAIEDETARAVVDLVTVYPGGLLPESAAMNDPSGVWMRTEQGMQWKLTLTNTHDGANAAEARAEHRDQATSLRRFISGPAMVSWWWQLQEHDEHELKAKLRRVEPDDTTLLARWDLIGATPWEKVITLVPPGLHVINWRYEFRNPGQQDLPKPGSAAQLDEFSAVPVTPVDVLGPPGQTWTFGGGWEVAAPSADTGTPGSIGPSSLPPGAGAWLESSFTGPILVRWNQQTDLPGFPGASLSLDGVAAPQAGIGTLAFDYEWTNHYALVPAGLHTLRWTFANAAGPDASQKIRFDHPIILPLMGDELRTALGVSAPIVFESGKALSQIVPNGPDGPQGNTALRLSGANTPVVAATGPGLFSYYYRRSGDVVPEAMMEMVNGRRALSLPTGDGWEKRSFFLTKSLALGWDSTTPSGSIYEIDGLSFDGPAADVNAFLARSAMTWNAPAGAAMVRVVDQTVPVPQGEIMFLLPAPSPPLTTQVTGPGVLEVDTTGRFAEPAALAPTPHVTANGVAVENEMLSLPDRERIRYAVPAGLQTLALSGSGAAVLRLGWQSLPGPVLTELAHEGLEGTGLKFYVTEPQRLAVREGGGGARTVAALEGTWPPAELSCTVAGPGTLSFEWIVSQGVAEFSIDALPAVAGTERWAFVRLAIPPGTHVLRWSARNDLEIDHVQWEPHTAAINPPAGILGSAARTSGGLWREHRGTGGETLVAPLFNSPEARTPVTLSVNGPGVFVCEARLLISRHVSHFTLQDGIAWVGFGKDGITDSQMVCSEEWLPLSVPLEGGPHEILLQEHVERETVMLPAVLEIRNAAVLPVRTAAAVARPGLTWEPSLPAHVTAAEFVTGRGSSVLWNLDAPFSEGQPPEYVIPALTAQIQGPGTLEWEASHLAGQITLSSDGGPVRELHPPFGLFYAFMPTHQLVLPAGVHRVTWAQYSPQFAVWPYAGPLSMAVRWSPSGTPPLGAVMPSPLASPLCFVSDGGWEPVPFDVATPWQRVRTRLAGPARVFLTLPAGAEEHSVWFMQGDAGFEEAAAPLVSAGFANPGPNWLEFCGPPGDRGGQMSPYGRSALGRVPASSAKPGGETFAQWAARMGVAVNPEADGDHDGMNNLLESALGTDPAVAESGAWQVLPGAVAAVRFLWPPIPTDVTRTIEVSADLIHWNAVVPEVAAGTATVLLTPPAKYARMKVAR